MRIFTVKYAAIMTYIYQYTDWPDFRWDAQALETKLATVRYQQGKLIGKMGELGFDLKEEASLEILTQDLLKSNEIEGEVLDEQTVRSSMARQLGLDLPGLVASDRRVDGLVELMLDATRHFSRPLTAERLQAWHHALFPSGYVGIQALRVGVWRDDREGPMQVVSGAMGRERVHFKAPPAEGLDLEMKRFLDWFETDAGTDTVLKAGLAHLWFVTLHPFDDGNGRIARAVSELMLARSDQQPTRFYSMSVQIRKERNAYYEALEAAQRSDLDVTGWLDWFLGCLLRALDSSQALTKRILVKHHFWQKHQAVNLHERQRKVLNKLLDGFEGKLTTSKYSRMCKCSKDTALRDIQHLLEEGMLEKLPGGGRSTGYGVRVSGSFGADTGL